MTSNPTNYGLYTPQMITDLNLGGVMLRKTGSNAVVSLQLQTTPIFRCLSPTTRNP